MYLGVLTPNGGNEIEQNQVRGCRMHICTYACTYAQSFSRVPISGARNSIGTVNRNSQLKFRDDSLGISFEFKVFNFPTKTYNILSVVGLVLYPVLCVCVCVYVCVCVCVRACVCYLHTRILMYLMDGPFNKNRMCAICYRFSWTNIQWDLMPP